MKISYIFFISQKETPSDVMLHLAALRGDVVELRRVLDTGKVHVDCKDEVSMIYMYKVGGGGRRRLSDCLLNWVRAQRVFGLCC